MRYSDIKKETRKLFGKCRKLVAQGESNVIPYIFGHVSDLVTMLDIVTEYKEDAEIDLSFEIITRKEYEEELEAIALLEKAISSATVRF